jgi:hypothetical protein
MLSEAVKDTKKSKTKLFGVRAGLASLLLAKGRVGPCFKCKMMEVSNEKRGL